MIEARDRARYPPQGEESTPSGLDADAVPRWGSATHEPEWPRYITIGSTSVSPEGLFGKAREVPEFERDTTSIDRAVGNA
jgi:hypothetical protein